MKQQASRRDAASKEGYSAQQQQRVISPSALSPQVYVVNDAARQAPVNLKQKSISSGRKHQQVPAPSLQPSVTPQLQSTQSMSSLSNRPLNGTSGRVLISPSNFATSKPAGGQQNQNIPSSQALLLQPSSGSRRQQHGSVGKMSNGTAGTGSGDVENLIQQHQISSSDPHQQMQVIDQAQTSQTYLKQLRKSQISALRQLRKPVGEQLQPSGTIDRQGNGLIEIKHQSGSHPKHSLSDRHQTKQASSSDQLLAQQQQSSNQQPKVALVQSALPESEYGSIGRQDQKIRFYKSQVAPHHGMSRQAAVGTGAGINSNKGSDENSDDFQAVAEEDMNSFILHRNAYLDGEIQTAESLLFKQQPKLGRDPRPNPNTNNGQIQQVTNATGSSGMAFQKQYSSQKQLITGSLASQLSQQSAGRMSQQNTQTPMHVEDITVAGPSSLKHASEIKQSRKQSINRIIGQSAVGSKSGRKSQHNQFAPGFKPQINTLAGPPDYQPQTRAVTTLAAPVSSGNGLQQTLFNASQQPVSAEQNQVGLTSVSESKRRATKGLQRVETLTSMGVNKPQYPMFPLEDNKKAMIQFEMNLLARANKQAAASYSLRQQQSDSQSQPALLNKATLCDSANSKQNSSQSAFLRKSLWLLTSTKNKALKDLVSANQATCQACVYLRRQGVGCLMPGHAQSLPHAQTFIQNQNDSQSNAGIALGGSSILLKNCSQGSIGNKGQSAVGSLPIEKQLSSSTAAGSSTLFVGATMKSPTGISGIGLGQAVSKNDGVYNRQNQVLKRHSQNRGVAKHSNLTGVYDKTTGGISSQGINWLGSMGTQILLVEHFEHDFSRLLTQKTLNTKYLTSQEYYNSKIAADIMYNEQRHIVSVFKEYLIFDDFSEYLKRFYTFKEAQDRLPRVFEFYEHYSKVFPNYVSVPESKYMFKNIERKQKLIDQRHQVFMKNQQNKEVNQDGKSPAGYKHSANMLFGSQFLREVYADDDKSMSKVSIDLKDFKKVTATGKKPAGKDIYKSPALDLQNRLLEHTSGFVSPQQKQAILGKRISLNKVPDASLARHQNELENVISMLSKFEQSRREGDSMSITISRSYVEGATGLGANPSKQTPQSVALQTDASRKHLHNPRSKKVKHMASHQNLESLKKNGRVGDIFTDGWNFHEPTHDLSMSSWALTSFIQNCDNQAKASMDTGSVIDPDNIIPFPADDLSIDDYALLTGKSKKSDIDQDNFEKRKKRKHYTSNHDNVNINIKQSGKNEVLQSQASPGVSGATTSSKNAQKAIENRRNSALSPKLTSETMKGLQSVALIQKSSLEQKFGSHQIIKTSRGEREKIKDTPTRVKDETKSSLVKKQGTAGGKTGTSTHQNLANSRCRSKLSIGSSQTQTQQNITKKTVQTQSKQQIEKMIKDSSIKMQLDKKNNQFMALAKRTGVSSTTNAQQPLKSGSIASNLAIMTAMNNEAFVGQIYNTSQLTSNPKSAKSQNAQNALINSSRNKQNANGSSIKSNSQLANAPAASIESGTAYKTSGHIPSSVVHSSSKVFKSSVGVDREIGINERFIDLNRVSENVPKIQKITGSVIKSSDFSKMPSSGLRMSDQLTKLPGSGASNLLLGVNNSANNNVIRTGQHGLGYRKSIDGQQIPVGNQQVSPMGSSGPAKLQGQVKTMQRAYHNRPLNKPELINENTQGITHQKSPSSIANAQSQTNLPQIFQKEQKDGTKQIRSSQYDLQLKTIFKYETSSNIYNSVQNGQLYTKKKQSPEQTQHQIQFNQQHTSSKSHEPLDRQSKQHSPQKLMQKDGGAQTTANSVIGHNNQHCLVLVPQNNAHQMINQAASGPTQNIRISKQDKLETNMMIQNNIIQKNSNLLAQQLSSSGKGTNPYAKTGRILNSLNTQKQSVQSLGHISGNSGTGSHHGKGGRNTKLNVKNTASNHVLKGTTGQSVSSSSSIGSSKISLNSGNHKSDSTQIYLKTLSRGNQVHLQTGMGTKSTMIIRKTPSNSSSKTKKIKVSSNPGSSSNKIKLKATSPTKNAAQNPYPAGASHGHTIFSVTMPRSSLTQTIAHGHQQQVEKPHY